MGFGLLALWSGMALAQEGKVSFPGNGASGGSPDYYLIQEGDTLWDISTRFLNDPYAWPELWSYNEYITNPHWIYPGNRVYFRLGDRLTPPSAGVSEQPAQGYQPPPAPVVASAAETECDFPPRFDQRYSGLHLTSPGLIGTAEDLGIRGRIYAAGESGLMLGEPSIIYIKLDDGVDEPRCGDLMGIYQLQQSKVKGPDGDLGALYRVPAIARVIRVDDRIVTARIRDSYSEVSRGDLVGNPQNVELIVDVQAPTDDLRAEIIARLHQEQFMPIDGETVFLNRGVDDGVNVGASLYVVERRDPSNLQGPEDDLLPERVVGRVVVVRAASDYATAVVVNAARDIQVGQRLTTQPNKR